MTLSFVRIDAREAEVEVRPLSDGRVMVKVDDNEYQVDVGPDSASSNGTGAGESLLVDGRQFEMFAHVVKSVGGTRTLQLSVNGMTSTASVSDPLSHLAEQSGANAGSARVEAYMPGRVVTLLVAEGETVEPGQGVLVLEAMKMENEIAAETGGVVSQFFVEEGQAVEGGDPLFEVEASADG